MCWNGWAKAVSRSSTRVKDFATEAEEEQRKTFATELHGKARKKKRFDFLSSCFIVALFFFFSPCTTHNSQFDRLTDRWKETRSLSFSKGLRPFVILANAGIHSLQLVSMDSRLRGNDGREPP